MTCRAGHNDYVVKLSFATQMAAAQGAAVPRCRNPKCNLPLQKNGACPRGCRQEGRGAMVRIPDAGLGALQDGLQQRYPGLDLWISQSAGGHLVIGRIIIPKTQRGQGWGTAVLEALTVAADAYGVPMAVTPDNVFGGSAPRLREFYRRFGFVPNQGRGKDYTTREAMVRPVSPDRRSEE